MGESFEKREKAKKKIKEKQDKAQKMKERKENNNKGGSLEDMMAYVDEYGNISSTPPDGKKPKAEIHLDDIQLGAAPITPEALFRTGIVSFFNTEKGYGFISDDKTRENIFVHVNQLLDPIKDRDRVSFERERTPKGYSATKVRKL